ncbi:MAG: four helix bundle protein [Bacteroidetes bacterium]|nr:four helix bundle protein [Bacteroidota bacterium]
MENNDFGFEQHTVWKKARDFKREVCKDTRAFPPEEKYRLTDQLIRSSRSVNALISEGHGRYTYPEQINDCIPARDSLSETINHLIDAHDEEYITEEKLQYYKAKGKELERLMNGYIGYLREKRDEQKK